MNIKRIQEIFEAEQSVTLTAKRYAEEEGLEYNERLRKKFSYIIHKNGIKDKDLNTVTSTETNQYTNRTDLLSAVKKDGTIMPIEEYCEVYGIPYEQVRTYKLVTHTAKGAYYNIASNPIKGKGFEEFYKKLIEEIKEISTLPITIKRVEDKNEDEKFLLVMDPADIHVGKLAQSFETGDNYGTNIAVQRTKEGVEGILNKVRGFPIDKILFIAGNDILHIDSPKRTTTSGTPQDTDSSWYSNFLVAKQLYIDILSRLLEVADVHVSFNPSNHDFTHGFFLLDVVKTYFYKTDNIVFDSDLRHRKYFRYHDNLIGTTHGDGAKTVDLGPLMAHEAKDWSKCKHRYIYTHHVHHKNAKDYIGVTIESLRSPSGTDGWHDRNGYTGVPKAIEGFLHSKAQGQIARITHIFF